MKNKTLRGILSCLGRNNIPGTPKTSIYFDQTSYIDTGLKTTGDYRFEVEFAPKIRNITNSAWLLGGRVDINYSLGVHIAVGGIHAAYGGHTTQYPPTLIEDKVYHLIMDKDKCTINGVNYLVTGRKLVPKEYEANIRAFGFDGTNYGGTNGDIRQYIGSGSKFRIYDYAINSYVRDYEARQDENGAWAMWCHVTNRFWYNDGPGEFSEGIY